MRYLQLGEIADIQLGKMLSPKAKTGKEPFPYLRNQNVQWDRFDLRDVAAMDFSERDRERFALRAGDLLICEGGEPGRCAVWEEQIAGCYYQKALHRVRPFEDVADPYFIALWIRHQALIGAFEDQNAKSTIAHLPLVRLQKLQVPEVDIVTQREIVRVTRERLAQVILAKEAAEKQLAEIQLLPQKILSAAFEM